MTDTVIYDGNCNLCVTLVQALERLDKGQTFTYLPMQYPQLEAEFGVTEQDCELGMMVINGTDPALRWQGSDAAEEIARRLPLSAPFVTTYRALPGMKWAGDRIYEQVRDNRYAWFGRRQTTYNSLYAAACKSGTCQPFPAVDSAIETDASC
ncbi:MAG: thiol-disulfide oxidoreductase DCC family protein [Synechococcus sp.]